MEEKMSVWGIGPIFVPSSIAYFTITAIITYLYYPAFQIKIVPYPIIAILGAVLLIIGIPFWIISVFTVVRAYNADRLVTTGIYRYCRHPLYASWTVFNVPGIALLLNSWIILTAAVLMYVILKTLVKKEEIYLENLFGSEYLDYKKIVPCIIPYGVFKT